jgi:hypothetical protein
MTSTLLWQFVREECNPHVRALIDAALSTSAPDATTLELNRFALTLDRMRGVATLEDITRADDAQGRMVVSLATLRDALGDA